MFEHLAFGGLDGVEDAVERLSTHKEVTWPDVVAKYVLNYSASKSDYPLLNMMDASVKAYEKAALDTISDLNEVFDAGQDAMYRLKAAQAISQTLNRFKQYSQVKEQVARKWTTPTWSSWYYTNYFRSWDRFRALEEMLGKVSSRNLQDMLLEGQMKLKDIEYNMFSMPRINFFNDKLAPIANRFSDADQRFLRDVLVMRQDGDVSADEINRLAKLLKSHFKPDELAVLTPTLSTMVLGPMSKWTFWATNTNVASESVAIIRGRLALIQQHLGAWLDPTVPGKIERVLAMVAKYNLLVEAPPEVYAEAKQLIAEIDKAIFAGPGNAFWSVINPAASSQSSAAVSERAAAEAQKAAEAVIFSGGTEAAAQKAATEAAKQVIEAGKKGTLPGAAPKSEASAGEGKSGGLLIGGLLLVGYLLSRRNS